MTSRTCRNGFGFWRAGARLSLAACGLLPAILSAQNVCRQPTDAERALIAQGQATARQIVEEGVKNSSWEPSDWRVAEVVASKPQLGRPFEFCDDFVAVKLNLRNDTERAHVLDSIIAVSQKAMQAADVSSIAKVGAVMFDAAAAKLVSIRVNLNDPYLFEPWPGKPGEVLTVPGVPFATREITHASDGTTQSSTELYIGDFAKAKQYAASKSYVPYPFRHKGGPYLENIEILLEGTPTSVEEVVRQIDWAKFGAVLTP